MVELEGKFDLLSKPYLLQTYLLKMQFHPRFLMEKTKTNATLPSEEWSTITIVIYFPTFSTPIQSGASYQHNYPQPLHG